MLRKLYALAILLGTFAALALFYLYFFVYYTGVVVIQSNVADYTVNFFATSTAQKRQQHCPEKICEIMDVSPFEYNITIEKEGYESFFVAQKVKARTKEEIIIKLEKKARLQAVLDFSASETAQEKIQRLREENLYYASFALDESSKLTFTQKDEKIYLQYRTQEEVREIASFPQVPAEDIGADTVSGSKNIFLYLAQKSYLFDPLQGKLISLPYEIPVLYIKTAQKSGEYLVVTQKGSFLYNSNSQTSEFQYPFADFVYWEEGMIGVIYTQEQEKKNNFNLTQKGNLVIHYTPKDKRRKVLLATELKIDRIELQREKVIVSAGTEQFELQNF